MTIERKVGMGIAGQPSGSTDVADVFSTYLYTGNNSTQTITNGIDLAGEGGMVWIKSRNNAARHPYIHDTERGIDNVLQPNSINAAADFSFLNLAVASNGFSMNVAEPAYNSSGNDYASWTFRKKEKFFDIVTWSGDDSTNRQISHSLSGPVGMIILKCTSHSTNWTVFHTSLGGTKRLVLNRGDISVQTSQEYWNNTNPTSTNFTVGGSGDNNSIGRTYVAYLFADNSAEDADDQMIKCGSFTGNGSATGPVVDLGWEPQFLITKVVNSNNWHMWDSMRGIVAGTGDARLYPGLDNVEDESEKLQLTSTGFQIKSSSLSINTSGVETIYMAIRAPMMIEPEAATDVFSIDDSMATSSASVGGFTANHVVDFGITKATDGSDTLVGTRLLGDTFLTINTTDAESANSFARTNGYQNDFVFTGGAGDVDRLGWMWKRAKGYMDVVAYSGSSSAMTLSHSLGVVPEMMWVKSRTLGNNWQVYHKTLGNTKGLILNENYAEASVSNWNNTTPTDTQFTLGANSNVSYPSNTYIAYLFATLPGISKVGSFTATGSDVNVDCGFSNGARFVLIKRTDGAAEWWFWDTVRGITAGNDSRMKLHDNSGEANADNIDPYSAGFTMTAGILGPSGQNYIFYAIA